MCVGRLLTKLSGAFFNDVLCFIHKVCSDTQDSTFNIFMCIFHIKSINSKMLPWTLQEDILVITVYFSQTGHFQLKVENLISSLLGFPVGC